MESYIAIKKNTLYLCAFTGKSSMIFLSTKILRILYGISLVCTKRKEIGVSMCVSVYILCVYIYIDMISIKKS